VVKKFKIENVILKVKDKNKVGNQLIYMLILKFVLHLKKHARKVIWLIMVNPFNKKVI